MPMFNLNEFWKNLWNKVFWRMFGSVLMEVMTLLVHLSNINKIQFFLEYVDFFFGNLTTHITIVRRRYQCDVPNGHFPPITEHLYRKWSIKAYKKGESLLTYVQVHVRNQRPVSFREFIIFDPILLIYGTYLKTLDGLLPLGKQWYTYFHITETAKILKSENNSKLFGNLKNMKKIL